MVMVSSIVAMIAIGSNTPCAASIASARRSRVVMTNLRLLWQSIIPRMMRMMGWRWWRWWWRRVMRMMMVTIMVVVMWVMVAVVVVVVVVVVTAAVMMMMVEITVAGIPAVC